MVNLGNKQRLAIITATSYFISLSGIWLAYLLVGQPVIEWIYHGNGPAVLTGLIEGREIYPLQDYLDFVAHLLWQVTIIITLVFTAAIVFILFSFTNLLLTLASFLFITIVVFSVFEIDSSIPKAFGFNRLAYYHIQETKIFDQTLVYRKKPFSRVSGKFIGQGYKNCYGVDATSYKYVMSYDENGFRNKPELYDVEVAVIGDSFIEMGHDEQDTFTARLQAHSGLRTGNYGIASYCPIQYVEVLERYVAEKRPRYAILAFYEGNDFDDITDYIRWRTDNSGWYYKYGGVLSAPFYRRYYFAVQNLGSRLSKIFEDADIKMRTALGIGNTREECRELLVDLRIAGANHTVVFVKGDKRSKEQLMRTEQMNYLEEALRKFMRISQQHGIIPIVMFIPTNLSVYAKYATERSGKRWQKNRKKLTDIANRAALASIVKDLSKKYAGKFFDLTPVFHEASEQGSLLYYPFDGHWNSEGREVAARYIAEKIRDLAH